MTPLQAVTLLWWVAPLAVASTYYSLSARYTLSKSRSSSPVSYTRLVTNAGSHGWLSPAWTLLNLLWFLLPFASFGLGLKSIEAGVGMRMVLAIALAASHPLSWNLSLVMIPTSGVLSKLIVDDADGRVNGSAKKHWFEFHRLVGYSTAFWGIVNASCELVFTCGGSSSGDGDDGFRAQVSLTVTRQAFAGHITNKSSYHNCY